MVSCWETGHSRESCCDKPSSCFDSIYTRKECCSTGFARLFPTADAVEVDWEDGSRWAAFEAGYDPTGAHPSFSSTQRAWEASISNASIRMSQEVLGHHLEFMAFKRSGPALGKVLEELSEDLYRLGHVELLKNQAPSAVAVDVGASIGLVSVLLCKLWAGARVVAMEPAPPNFRYLLWNLRINHVTDCASFFLPDFNFPELRASHQQGHFRRIVKMMMTPGVAGTQIGSCVSLHQL